MLDTKGNLKTKFMLSVLLVGKMWLTPALTGKATHSKLMTHWTQLVNYFCIFLHICMWTTKLPAWVPCKGKRKPTPVSCVWGSGGGTVIMIKHVKHTHSCEHLCPLTPCRGTWKRWITFSPQLKYRHLMASSRFTAAQLDQPTKSKV